MTFAEAIGHFLFIPPQNSVKVKKLGGGETARKILIGSTNNQWEMKKNRLIKVSFYFPFSLLANLVKNFRCFTGTFDWQNV